MDNDRSFLAKEPLGKLLVKFAIPSVTAQIINILYNIVDRIYIGHMADSGPLALTGVGVCLPLIVLISAFAALVGSGGAPRASIAMGQGNIDQAEQIMGNCFTLQIIISVILTIAIYVFGEQLLLLFGASQNTIIYAAPYMRIYSLGTIFVQFSLGMNLFITAQGSAKVSMMTVIIGAVSNIILDQLFIYGFGMGVRGAALATIISQAFAAIWILCFLFGKKTALKIKKKYLVLKKSIVGSVVSLGLAQFIMQSTESLISICFNASLLRFGGDLAVGAMTIGHSIMQFATTPISGIGQGAQPIISYNYGARQKDRVKQAYLLLLKVDFVAEGIIWTFSMLAPRFLCSIFSSDEALVSYAAKMLRIYMASMSLFAIQLACQATFTSIGYAKNAIMVACMRKIILLVPLIYIMPAIFTSDKVFAVFLAEPVADFLSVTFCSCLFFVQFRKALKSL